MESSGASTIAAVHLLRWTMAELPAAVGLVFLMELLMVSSSSGISVRGETQQQYTRGPARLTFYMQDRQLIQDSTGVVIAARGGNLTLYDFGTLIAMDDPLTETPSNASRLLGRGQGMYLVDSRSDFHLLVSYSAFLETEECNGTLVFHGSYKALESPRELPVIAGTGDFRGVQGYAIVTTYSDYGLYVVLEFKCFLHYPFAYLGE